MVIKLASLCFKSKCRECSVCGGRIKIIRDIQIEEELDLQQPRPNNPIQQSQNNL
jgi:hypothetical protein